MSSFTRLPAFLGHSSELRFTRHQFSHKHITAVFIFSMLVVDIDYYSQCIKTVLYYDIFRCLLPRTIFVSSAVQG